MPQLPNIVQDFIAERFTDQDIRAAKAQAAQETYDSLRADEYGEVFPDELASDICQALLSDGEDMMVKLSLAVRDCIDREDSALYGRATEPITPEVATPASLTETQNTAAAVDQAVMDAEEVFRDLGRLEGISFMATVADVAAAQVFEKIKKNKAYKNIPYFDEAGNRQYITDLEEFCRVKLGKSYSRVKQLSQNLRTLGPDLYESAEKIGFRAKDYRALKALPEAEQEVVKTAIASESKDEVLSILEDMAARHQAEREAAKKERDELSADLEARGKLLQDKSGKLERTEEELYKLKSLPPDADLELKLAREEEAVKAVDKVFVTALAEFNKMLMQVDAIISNEDVAMHTKQYAVQTVQMYCEDMNSNLANYGIAVDFEGMVSPEWLRDTAQADLQEGRTDSPNVPWSR
jgi:hypothetical protein